MLTDKPDNYFCYYFVVYFSLHSRPYTKNLGLFFKHKVGGRVLNPPEYHGEGVILFT